MFFFIINRMKKKILDFSFEKLYNSLLFIILLSNITLNILYVISFIRIMTSFLFNVWNTLWISLNKEYMFPIFHAWLEVSRGEMTVSGHSLRDLSSLTSHKSRDHNVMITLGSCKEYDVRRTSSLRCVKTRTQNCLLPAWTIYALLTYSTTYFHHLSSTNWPMADYPVRDQ